VNLGGIDVDLFDLGEVIFTFRDSENKPIEIKSRCCIGRIDRKIRAVVNLPSIIGMDFLKEKKAMTGFDEDGNPCMEIH